MASTSGVGPFGPGCEVAGSAVDAREHHPRQLAQERRKEMRSALGEAVREDPRRRQEDVRPGDGAVGRDDGTPLNYTLVNLRDWCKNSFEVIVEAGAAQEPALF